MVQAILPDHRAIVSALAARDASAAQCAAPWPLPLAAALNHLSGCVVRDQIGLAAAKEESRAARAVALPCRLRPR